MGNMFISKLGCSEHRGNHSLTTKCRFKNLKIKDLPYVLYFKPVQVAFMLPLFLADLDKKYKNKIEMDKNNSVTYMKYVNLKLGIPGSG